MTLSANHSKMESGAALWKMPGGFDMNMSDDSSSSTLLSLELLAKIPGENIGEIKW